MSHRIRFTDEACSDIKRLYAIALDTGKGTGSTPNASSRPLKPAWRCWLRRPSCRKAAEHALQRELVIGFGSTCFVAIYEVEDADVVTIMPVRHQRDDDYR